MKYLMMLFSLLMTGCGHGLNIIPPEVLGYYEEYYQIVGMDKEIGGTIQFADLSAEDEKGICTWNLLNWGIKLDEASWNSYNDIQKKTLLFHELTHCTFHSSSHSIAPNSYMYAHLNIANMSMTETQLVEDVKQYVSDLIAHKQ